MHDDAIDASTLPIGRSGAGGDLARFQDLGELGRGGGGVVRRVLDPALERAMALKLLHTSAGEDPDARTRFVQEAKLTAQLEHPGILPVHELGVLPDGTPWFTMKEVRGRTLGQVIHEVHAASGPEGWAPGPGGWTFRRLIDAFHRACQAVAYAHSRGILHRDLKPQNLMVGDFGEVLVLDWGLARVIGDGGSLLDLPGGVSPTSPEMTSDGEVAGTPAYMSPEQARGHHRSLNAASDVFSLGAVLFEILTGRAPFAAPTPVAVLARVVQGRREPMLGRAPIPEELASLCDRAMALDPQDRPRDAGALAAAVAEWLEGARKRERGLDMVQEADRRREEAHALRARAARLREEARAILEPLPPWADVASKQPGWRLEDEAAALERSAELAVLESTQRLAVALEECPDLPEARRRLADHYHALHAAAEALQDEEAATRYELLLRAHDRGAHAAWLSGDGALTLLSDPPGAIATLYQYQLRDRRLVPELVRELGPTPLVELTLPRGSYLVILRMPGRAEVRYPVQLGRGERWEGVPPGGSGPQPVWLPEEGALGPGEVYVPAGWFASGERDRGRVPGSLAPGRRWVDAFVIQRFPITHGRLIGLLRAMQEEGREAEALALAPRLRDSEGVAYGRDERGLFELRVDPQGDLWRPDWPAFLLDWEQAAGIAEEFARREGRPWRLPREVEWEKAARGVDRRRYPWGEHAEPTWASLRDCAPGRILPAPVDHYPVDEGPYGVRGMAGGVSDWCASAFLRDRLGGLGDEGSPGDAARRVVRGGAFSQFIGAGQLSRRVGLEPGFRDYGLGLRLARGLG